MQELTLSQGDSLASPSVLREIKKRKKIADTSGRKCLELFHKQNQLGSFVKMFMGLLSLDLMKCSTIWKVEATPHNRLLFRLWPTVQTIDETEFILWPTPQAMDSMKARPPDAMKKQMTIARKGRSKIGTMKDAAVYGIKWEGTACRLGEGELNPMHLEWMMNYPAGWTEIKH